MSVNDWQIPTGIVVTAAAAGILAWLVGRVVRRLGRRPSLGFLVAIHRGAHRPWIATVMAVSVLLTLEGRPEVGPGWQRGAAIAVIATTCWLIVAGLAVGQRIVEDRLPIDVQDNRRARRLRTQVLLLKRAAVALVVVLGVAAVLMTFPGLRTFGASLLASAGIAGLVAGLAAQTTLGNVFAGLQLAFTDAMRVDDVIVVEKEWGRVEDITLTYVVLHLWDERRLVLPTSYFVTKPFENWTRTHSRVVGSVILHLDFRTPMHELREKARAVIEASPLWDRRDWIVQVVDTTESTMVVRVLASAYDAPSAWDLRCDVREELLAWLAEHHPEALPAHRSILDPGTPRDGLTVAAARQESA